MTSYIFHKITSLFRRRFFLLLAAFVLSLGAVAYFVFTLDADLFVGLVGRVDWAAVVCAVVLYALSLYVRAVRLGCLLPNRISMSNSLRIIGKYSFLNYFMPLKLGEFSMPIMLRSHDVLIAEALWVWFVARVFDLILVVFLALLVFGAFMSQFQLGDLVVLSLVCISLFMLAFKVEKIRVFLISILHKLVGVRLHQWFTLVWTTIVSWALVYSMYFILMLSMGKGVELWVCVTALVFMAPIAFLPINTVASVGGFQAAWVAALVVDGWDSDVAMSVSVVLHVLVTGIVAIVFLGFEGFSFIRKRHFS